MKWEDIEPKANAIRSSILNAMNGMLARKEEWGLAREDPSFGKAKGTLEKPEFNIVVCGEVKRGKSTFINALLGRDLLPTGVQETTSQVFRVTNAETESFALEFADGRREPITRDELVRYGSQVAADQEKEPLLKGRALKWIDAYTKAAFLPKGVHLVDTPGLGALYSAHSAITNGYVVQADVVIFILSSDNPLVQSEKEFLKSVYSITPNVLFVQTKIDTKNEADWKTILQRNEELLNETFGGPNKPHITVYPVASKLLFDAANQRNEMLREIKYSKSRFDAFREALDATMYRAVGWTRSAVAVTQACGYHQMILRFFEEQRRMLASTSETERKQLTRSKVDLQKQFQQNWSVSGVKRLEVKQKVTKIINSVKSRASAIGIQGSSLCTRFTDMVDCASDVDSLKNIASRLPSEMSGAYAEEWRKVIDDIAHKIDEELKDYSITASEGGVPGVNLSVGTVKEGDMYSKIRGVYMGGMTGLGIAGIGLGLGSYLLDIVLTGGVFTTITIISSVIGALLGLGSTKESELDRAKQDMKSKVYEMSCTLRNAILLPKGDSDSLVDQFIENAESGIAEAMNQMYELEKARIEQQIQKLEEQSALNVQQSQEALVTLKDRMLVWAEIGNDLQNEVVNLRQLQDALS